MEKIIVANQIQTFKEEETAPIILQPDIGRKDLERETH
jgi:hypothetical protein